MPIIYTGSWCFDTPTHDISTSLAMVFWPLFKVHYVYWKACLWYIEPPTYPLLMVFWPHTVSIVYLTPCLGYFELIVMVYWTHHLWDFDTPTHDTSNSLPIVYWPPTHCILNTLIFWHLYAWFTEPRIYDILTSLPMAYWTPYLLYFDPLPMVYRTPCLWNIKHPTHGVLNPLPIVFWPSSWLMVNRTPFQ